VKVLFMGTPEFAVASLDRIVEKGWEVPGVITQPDRPKGRGKKVQPPSVKVKAIELGIEVFQPTKIKERQIIDNIKDMKPDIIVVVAYGQILPEEILNLPSLGCINVHASLLPGYRGAAPINWAVINGEKYSGITTMYMDKGLDTGDMIYQERVEIGEQETAGGLHDKLAVLGADVLAKTLRAIENGEAPRIPQDHSKATYAPQLERRVGKVEWNKDVLSIFNLIRGTNPWPGGYTCYGTKKMKLWKTRVADINSNGIPGTIVEVGRKGLRVQTGKGSLLIEEMQIVRDNEAEQVEEKNIIIWLLFGLLVVGIAVVFLSTYFLFEYSEVFYKILVTIVLILFALKVVSAFIAIIGIYYIVYRKRDSKMLKKIAIKVINQLYSLVMVLSNVFGIDRGRIQRAYANLNNRIVCSAQYDLMPEDILLLLPHCLQNNECKHRITGDIRNCKKCGKCVIKDIIELIDRYPVKVAVVPGGTLARKRLKDLSPKAVVAVACERDLASGIHDAGSFVPVVGIFNKRPNGPCFNTNVDIEKIEDVIKFLCNRRCG